MVAPATVTYCESVCLAQAVIHTVEIADPTRYGRLIRENETDMIRVTAHVIWLLSLKMMIS
jgi:bifunctional N-acetylglucosamine-1-phosphate-uridyltransferase/glucosamine-1-phosphate-acetyltransferase GlmU-like protein